MTAPFPAKSKIRESELAEARRHLFLCIGPDCCDPAVGSALWDILKAECKRLSVPVLRTKAGCLRICQDGPWLVVYPEGIWYGQVDEDRLGRILRKHVEEGRPVAEWIAARTGGTCA